MLSRLAVGGLLIEAVEGWEFHILDGVIVGRSDHGNGVLRMKTRPPNELPHPLTHRACLAMVCGFADTSWLMPSARKVIETATGPLGSASYHKRKDHVHVWYCLRPPGLVMGAYSCPWEAHRSRAERQAGSECEVMVSTAIFDRPAWGANDAITKVLVAELRRSEGQTATGSRGRRGSSDPKRVQRS